MKLKAKLIDSLSRQSKNLENIQYFLPGGQFAKKKLKEASEEISRRVGITGITPLPEEELIRRAINNENAIAIYKQRLLNGGRDYVEKSGKANFKAKDILVMLDKKALEKKIEELDLLEHPLPYGVEGDLAKVLKSIRTMLANNNISEKDALLDVLDLAKKNNWEYNGEVDIDECKQYILKPDSPKLKNWKELGNQINDSGHAIFNGNYVWAPNEETLKDSVFWRNPEARAASINYWQTTLPHEFEHAFLNGDLVYAEYAPKHAIPLIDLLTAVGYTPELLRAMQKEMRELIGIDPSRLAVKKESTDLIRYLTLITELLARGTQIKNWLGITNPNYKLTAKDLKEAAVYYTFTGPNNNMNDLFNTIVDWDKAAKFLSKATAVAGVTGSAALALNNLKLSEIFKKGGALNNKEDIPDYFKIYGINPDKLYNMYTELLDSGLSHYPSMMYAWQAIKELPKKYYAFGKSYDNIKDWAKHSSEALTGKRVNGIYKDAQYATNYEEWKKAMKSFNTEKEDYWTKWLPEGLEEAELFINNIKKGTEKPTKSDFPPIIEQPDATRVTRNDFLPISKKFLEGGIIVGLEAPQYRYITSKLAEDFDNLLKEFYYKELIKNGELTAKAELVLLRKFNLDKDLLEDTILDLVKNGFAKIFAPKEENISFNREGGVLIPKHLKGNIIKLLSEGVERMFTPSGRMKEFGKETADKLWTSAKNTKDRRLIQLATIANKSRVNHTPYPEEFVNYVDSILKEPITTLIDTKTIKKMSRDGVTPAKSLNTEILFAENPETKLFQLIESPKLPTTLRKTIHTGEFKDKNSFKRKSITEKTLKSKNEDIDNALLIFLDILNGNFKVSEKMVEAIYSKSFGKMSSHLDEAINTSTIRHEFNFVEYPQILTHQLTLDLGEVPVGIYELLSRQNIELLRRQFEKLEKILPGHTIVPISRTPLGKPYALTGITIGKDFDFKSPEWKSFERKVYNLGYKQGVPLEKIKEALNNYKQSLSINQDLKGNDRQIKFLDTSIIIGEGDPYVVQYAFKNPITGELTPIEKYEEHHALALAELMARAYVKNPKPLDPEEMLNLYKGLREVDFLNNFLLLTKQLHTGKFGIHYNDKYTLQDLGRIKNLSRMGNFKSLEELLNYYDQIVKKRSEYFTKKAKLGTKLIPKKNAFGSTLMRHP